MSMIISTNMASENATRLLDRSSREMSTSMERLTSGLRINSSADDVGGRAVATAMNTQITGTTRAIANANDGVSLLQTVDAASDETTNMLTRMREVALQSSTGTFSTAQRDLMNAEVTQIKDEITRLAETAQFNGVNLMNSAAATNTVDIQVGWQNTVNDRIAITLVDMRAGTAGVAGVSAAVGISAVATVAGTGLGVAGGVATVTGARALLTQVDAALVTVATAKAGFGAVQNRMDFAISNMQSMNTNLMDAKTKIEGADFAKESANLARTQVLQQAGMSMLSQANQNAQNVLGLLR